MADGFDVIVAGLTAGLFSARLSARATYQLAREYWDKQWMLTLIRPRAVLGIEPYATYLEAAPDEPVRMCRPEDISVVVVGGETGAPGG